MSGSKTRIYACLWGGLIVMQKIITIQFQKSTYQN